MTQEPRETSTDEPQVTLKETDEAVEQESATAGEVADHNPNETDDQDQVSTEDLTEPFEEDPDPADQGNDDLLHEEQTAPEGEACEEQKPDETTDDKVEDDASETNNLPEESEAESEVVDEGELEQEEDAVEEDSATESDEVANDSEEEQGDGGDGAEAPSNDEPDEETDEQTPTIESVVEAILFATDEPLTDGRLANIVETTAGQVRKCIQTLNEKYEKNHNAFRIEQIAGGHQMLTLSIYDSWLRKMLKARSDNKLSPAAMETLAIIAYKQPVIRVDIEAIRGVAVGEVIRSLMYKGLVKIVGRAEILGRPMLYGTTKKFLEVFGLHSLKDLPKAEELKKPD